MKESKIAKIVSEGIRNISKVKLKPYTTTRYMFYRAVTCNYPIEESIGLVGGKVDVHTLYEIHSSPLHDTLQSAYDHYVPLQPFNLTNASDNPS